MDEQARLPRPDRDRPLAEVFAELCGRLCPSGPHGEIDEWSIYDESFRRIVAWAQEFGCYYQGFQPLREGGREHDLWHKMAFARPGVAVFDLRPANVVRTADGLIVPIDTIPVKLDVVGERLLGL